MNASVASAIGKWPEWGVVGVKPHPFMTVTLLTDTL